MKDNKTEFKKGDRVGVAKKIKQDLRSVTEREMIELAEQFGEKPFRGRQLFEWIHHKQVKEISQIHNLPKRFLEQISEQYIISGVKIRKKQVSKTSDTAKYLFSLSDGSLVESVWMKYHHGNSVCISSQVGCRMGCVFCASTLKGLSRNLTAGEMLSQIYEIQQETGERVSNVIVMGMGEPLDNYDNLLTFIRLVSHEKGIQISQRSITVSTCGLVEKMQRLMGEKLQITLAVSLHAPNDEIRRCIMPVAKKYGVEEIFSACRKYIDRTGRRVTFEYSMIDGVNDRKEHAEELAGRLKGMNCHVNLIPLNDVKERESRRSREQTIREFRKILESRHVNVTVRRELGGDIDAACGQLRNTYMEKG